MGTTLDVGRNDESRLEGMMARAGDVSAAIDHFYTVGGAGGGPDHDREPSPVNEPAQAEQVPQAYQGLDPRGDFYQLMRASSPGNCRVSGLPQANGHAKDNEQLPTRLAKTVLSKLQGREHQLRQEPQSQRRRLTPIA